MLTKQTSLFSLMLSLIVVVMAITGGIEARKAMLEKAQNQITETNNFKQWEQEYTQLLPVEENWLKLLPSVSKVKDLYSIYLQLGKTPTTNPDKLIVLKIEQLSQNSKDLAGQKICLGSLNGSGLVFEEASFEPLLAGLRTLAIRSDVQMGTVVFTKKENTAQATVQDFCLLFRDVEPSDKKDS